MRSTWKHYSSTDISISRALLATFGENKKQTNNLIEHIESMIIMWWTLIRSYKIDYIFYLIFNQAYLNEIIFLFEEKSVRSDNFMDNKYLSHIYPQDFNYDSENKKKYL